MASNAESNVSIELVQTRPKDHETEDQDIAQHLLPEAEQLSQEPGNTPQCPESLDDKRQTESLTVWTLDVIALILSIGTIIAIAIILNHYDGKPQPDWQGISLNSLIAWLSTLSKACLLFCLTESIGQLKWAWFSSMRRPVSDLKVFDSASRGGVYGSLELLWRVKGRHLAAFGSLAVILSLAFDPFIQNLLHYVPDTIESPSQSAFLQSTSRYDVAGPVIGAGFHYVDPILKGNIYNSLLNPNSSESWAVPSYTCPTGNCTWDPFMTLAVRPLCTDVTDRLNKTCTTDATYPDIRTCTASLGSQGQGPSAWYRDGGSATQAMDVTPTTTNALVYNNTVFPVIQYVLALDSNTTPDATWDVASLVNNQTIFQATECALQLTILTIQATVTNGVYTETTLSEWSEIETPNATQRASYQVILSPPQDQSPGVAETEGASNRTFGISYEAWSSITAFLNSIFAGSVNAASGHFGFSAPNETSGLYATSDVLGALFYGSFRNSSVPFLTVQGQEEVSSASTCTDQLTCAIHNVAAAMSKTFRDTAFTSSSAASNGDQALIQGKAFIVVPFVKVVWEWLILPLCVWALTLCVWIAAVVRTRRGGLYKWTNNPLPLLFLYRGQAETPAGAGVSQVQGRVWRKWTEGDLDSGAKRVNVRLEMRRGEVVFCEQIGRF
ncbi:hypothetical protein BJY04DRAFT_233338 [Aspergillus karnatakaensis]|uniref:DUF3176 domain-containing protein n=1 Tax=Aspergillus karnatakaensis TaxID=1810916 RepID=UPI003CCD6C83